MSSTPHLWLVVPRFWRADTTPARRLNVFAESWQQSGHPVSVFTTPPLDEEGTLYSDFVDQERTGHYQHHNLALHTHAVPEPALTLDGRLHWNAALILALRLLRNMAPPGGKRPSVILTSLEEPVIACVAWLLSVRYRVPLIADWATPNLATAQQTGQLQRPLLLKILAKLQAFVTKRAKRIVTATAELQQDLVAKGVAAERCNIIPTAVADTALSIADKYQQSGALDRLRNSLQLSPLTKIVLYMGPHTLPFALGQIIDTARLLLGRANLLFLFAGNGPDKVRLKKLAAGMPNIQFIAMPTPDQQPAVISLAHICLLTHRDIAGAQQVVPARLLDYMATGTATIAASNGATIHFAEASEASLTVPAESPEQLARAIEELLDNPTRATELAKQGRLFIQEQCLASTLAPEYWRIIEQEMVK